MIIKELAECNNHIINQLVLLDQEAVLKYGESFSEEAWSKSNFLYKLPFKDSKSLVIMDENFQVLGFSIVSLKDSNNSYIHRFVSKNSGKTKVSDILMKEILERNKKISLVVSTLNKAAITFYEKYGFEIVYDKNLQKKIFPNKSPILSDGIIHTDYKFLMNKVGKKKILCNISGHEIPSILNDEMQLVQTYTRILDVFDEVHFICRSVKLVDGTIKHPTKPIYIHHVKVKNTPFGKTIIAWFKLFFAARKKRKIYKIDYFIASEPTIGGVVCFFLKFFNKQNYIIEIQAEMTRISPKVIGWSKAKLFKFLTLFIAKHAFRVRAVSETVGQQLIEDGINPKKIRIITSRVKLDKFNFLDYQFASQEIREKYKIKKEEELFVFLGRLVVFKGVTYLLKALSIFDDVPYKLLIVGDGILRTELENEVDKLGLREKVIFHGSVDFSEVPFFMACADLMILPSTDEGFPRVMLEAMAMKKLVAGSLVGGVRDIASDGENGYFFPPQDPKAIAKTLQNIYKENKKKHCIENAYQLVIEKYEFEKSMIDYNKLLNEMIIS